jgi:hypothetical protein
MPFDEKTFSYANRITIEKNAIFDVVSESYIILSLKLHTQHNINPCGKLIRYVYDENNLLCPRFLEDSRMGMKNARPAYH